MPEIIYKNKNAYKHRRPHHSPNKIQGVISIIIIIAIILGTYIQLDRQIIPTVLAMAKIQANSVATKAINQGITQSLITNQTTMQDLMSYDYNDSGELVSWNVNSIMINNLCASIVDNTMDELQTIGVVKFKIPLGNLTGSRLFANIGPEISVDVLPIGTVRVNYDNSIRSTGINQVNHTVWLDVEATVQVVVPLFSDQVIVKRRVVLIDKVISGDVPPNYVNIPEKDILEVIPSDSYPAN
ncbi:sporulation protein YunB [Cellulosilyticum sp. I15G10I2]|uniref:sporulation protein YunB n=1 Tax=Cellulosilyticum sp. I15G10I2 TaxID=1892843 RepID=UPI00085CA55E|nr:sporulation protein YunB [Cellulosilyticum sp. I15G10I2]